MKNYIEAPHGIPLVNDKKVFCRIEDFEKLKSQPPLAFEYVFVDAEDAYVLENIILRKPDWTPA